MFPLLADTQGFRFILHLPQIAASFLLTVFLLAMDRPHLPQRSTINQAPNDDASQAGSVVEEIGSIPTSGRFPETRKRPCEEPSTEEIFTKRIKDVQRISEVEGKSLASTHGICKKIDMA